MVIILLIFTHVKNSINMPQYVNRTLQECIMKNNYSCITLTCMQDTFARATHSAGRPSAARDDRVSCIQYSYSH